MLAYSKSGGKIPLKEIMNDVENLLKKMNYSKNSLRHYWEVWKRYLKFSTYEYLSESETTRFLLECYRIEPTKFPQPLSKHMKSAIRAIRVLFDYNRFGTIFIRNSKYRDITWPENYREEFENFIDSCIKNGKSESWINGFKYQFKLFVSFLDRNNIKKCSDIKSKHITEYIATLTGYKSKAFAVKLSQLRVFLRYLYLNEYHGTDLSVFVPSVTMTEKHIPHIWKKDEVKAILNVIDRGNPTGKRNYAMLLLIANTGIRISDVCNLKFDNLLWERNCIELIQMKTGEILCFPIYEELGMAIIDYLKNGRPSTNCPNIFVRHNAPFEAIGKNNHLHSVFCKYQKLAGVNIPPNKHHGVHTLRHTLATELLQLRVPLPVITEILGHRDISSAAFYLQLDIDSLRQCGLNPEV